MKYRILVDYEDVQQGDMWVSTPIYKEFDDANKANECIQEFLSTTDYSVVGVSQITPEVIEMYFDIV